MHKSLRLQLGDLDTDDFKVPVVHSTDLWNVHRRWGKESFNKSYHSESNTIFEWEWFEDTFLQFK